MGTKAVFKIKGSDYRLACMTDGTREGLEYIAHLTLKQAEKLGILDAIKAGDANSVEKVFQAVAEFTEGWCFVVREKEIVPHDVISHSAYWCPRSSKLTIWDGLWDINPKVVNLLSSTDKRAQYEAEREEYVRDCGCTD
jgi:hypothetical protein